MDIRTYRLCFTCRIFSKWHQRFISIFFSCRPN